MKAFIKVLYGEYGQECDMKTGLTNYNDCIGCCHKKCWKRGVAGLWTVVSIMSSEVSVSGGRCKSRFYCTCSWFSITCSPMPSWLGLSKLQNGQWKPEEDSSSTETEKSALLNRTSTVTKIGAFKSYFKSKRPVKKNGILTFLLSNVITFLLFGFVGES